jgi:hypothetical protein
MRVYFFCRLNDSSYSLHTIIVGTVASYDPSVCMVSPKIFVNLVGNREFEVGFLREAFEERDFPSYVYNLL